MVRNGIQSRMAGPGNLNRSEKMKSRFLSRILDCEAIGTERLGVVYEENSEEMMRLSRGVDLSDFNDKIWGQFFLMRFRMRALLVEYAELRKMNQPAIIISRDACITLRKHVKLTLLDVTGLSNGNSDFQIEFLEDEDLKKYRVIKEIDLPENVLGDIIDVKDAQFMLKAVNIYLKEGLERTEVSGSCSAYFFLEIGSVGL